MEDLKQNIDKLVAETKKEIDRLTDRRSEELGNGINYVENEMQIERLNGKIEGLQELYEKVIGC